MLRQAVLHLEGHAERCDEDMRRDGVPRGGRRGGCCALRDITSLVICAAEELCELRGEVAEEELTG